MKNKLKISFNSPVVLTFAAVCLVVIILHYISRGFITNALFVCYGHASLLNPLTYLRMFTYVFGHADFSHFAGNMTLLLLVGQIVEERFGSWITAVMIIVTALAG